MAKDNRKHYEGHSFDYIKPSPADDRDYQMQDLMNGSKRPVAMSAKAAQRVIAQKLPAHYISVKLPAEKVFDQGETGMCGACALAASRYITEKAQTKNPYRFSPADIYGMRPDNSILKVSEEGTIISEALNQLTDMGPCTYTNFNYWGTFKQCRAKRNKYKAKLDKVGKYYKIDSYYRCNGLNQIKQAVYSFKSALISIPCFEDYGPDWMLEDNLKWPEVSTPDNGNYDYNQFRGYHAVLAIGWTAKGLLILNSWGSEWGKNGVAVLPYDYPIQEAWAIIDNTAKKAPVALRKEVIVPKAKKAKKKK